MRITPQTPSPRQDIHTTESFRDLLINRFDADKLCQCSYFACPQCDINELYRRVVKLAAFIKED